MHMLQLNSLQFEELPFVDHHKRFTNHLRMFLAKAASCYIEKPNGVDPITVLNEKENRLSNRMIGRLQELSGIPSSMADDLHRKAKELADIQFPVTASARGMCVYRCCYNSLI
ncbi:unnamed protein product [Orchesella dallaii]|uniref:Uncharacterized protein n=1 Tax=Orchesella dallaii TaxID=48710 RepID=A0ABP1QTN0_9HEXA